MIKEVLEKNDNKEKSNGRVVYLDILRILATIAVIVLHVSSYNWNDLDPSCFEWNVFNFFDSIVRWAVPIFVMISGAIFLNNNKQIDIKQLYKKNIARIIISLVFWSFLYAIIYALVRFIKTNQIDVLTLIKSFIDGHYHLWFLYMIVGLYIITPLLRKITADEKTTKYFLIISLIFTFIIPNLLELPVFSETNTIFNKMQFHFTLGYSSYFVLGYYLSKKEITLKTRRIIYIISIASFIFTILGSSLIAQHKGEPFGIYDPFYLNVLFESIGIFVLIKNLKLNITAKTQEKITKLQKYCFGIYLVHALIITILSTIGLDTLNFNPILSVVIISIITFLISLIISAIINKIPILKKYIV